MNLRLFRHAVTLTSPIFFGYIAIGIPFGILTVNAGYAWWVSVLISFIMYTGAGQYLAIGMLASGATLQEILIAEFFVNIRHIVYGLSLIEKFRHTGRWKPIIIYLLTDETYALLSNTASPCEAKPGPFYATVAILNFAYWTLGAALGALLCSILHRYGAENLLSGVDFALTALFTVILIEQIKTLGTALPPIIGLVACTACIVLYRLGFLPQSGIIILAIALGVVFLSFTTKRRQYE